MVTYDEYKQFYNKFPERPNSFYYKQFPEGNKSTIRSYKYRCRIAKKTVATHDATPNKRKKKITKPIPEQPPQVEGLANPPTIPINAVNDPVGFVTFIITDELLKTRDVRWATLFVSVLRESKKLDYNTQQEIEWSNQAKSLSIEQLVEKVAIKGSISKSILRRLDKADSTSRSDSSYDV
ncbi:hypothetical protein LCGC14_2140580 [marine sediment metagenome]|uniref:Uncharacterized protein n=1 Tax=marine sediment metagenome TaxID=412755 RepID=A0A0F9DYG2_9ZZZZ